MSENLFRYTLGDGSLFGADPILGLPALTAIIRRPVDVEILGPPPHTLVDTCVVTQLISLLEGRFKAIERTVDVVAVINDVPFHRHAVVRRHYARKRS